MQIPAEGIDERHEKYINLGFAPWNIYKFFRYCDGTVVRLKAVYYGAGGTIKATFGSGKHLFVEDSGCNLDKYELIKE